MTVRGISLLEASTIHATAETVGVVVPVAAIFSVSDSSLASMLNSLGIGWVRVVFILLTMRSFGLIFRNAIRGKRARDKLSSAVERIARDPPQSGARRTPLRAGLECGPCSAPGNCAPDSAFSSQRLRNRRGDFADNAPNGNTIQAVFNWPRGN